MAELLLRETMEAATSTVDVGREKALLKDIKGIVESLRGLYDMAYDAYLPLVDDICSCRSSEYEVEQLLDWMLDFAGESDSALPARIERGHSNLEEETAPTWCINTRKEPSGMKPNERAFYSTVDSSLLVGAAESVWSGSRSLVTIQIEVSENCAST